MKRKTKSRRTQINRAPRYALRKGLGFWELTFEGRHAILKHQQGLYYVAWLLTHPAREPIHGLALTLKAAALYGRRRGLDELPDPLTGELALIGQEAWLQERSLGFDDLETAGALRRKQLALEALLDDKSQIEPVHQEALRELEAIYKFQAKNPCRTTDAAQKAVRAVRMAINRLQLHLAKSVDAAGNPHPLFRPFAAHLDRHLLAPSAGYARRRLHTHLGSSFPGCFIYEPPTGVVWAT